MLNVPSGFSSQPSNTGAMFCPRENISWPLPVSRAPTTSSAMTCANGAFQQAVLRLLLLARRVPDLFRLARGDFLLELLVGERDDPSQEEKHVVDRPVAVALPVPRIDVPRIAGR